MKNINKKELASSAEFFKKSADMASDRKFDHTPQVNRGREIAATLHAMSEVN